MPIPGVSLPALYKSAHYDFHFRPGSLAQRDIREIAATQESCYEAITALLGVEPDFRLHYYLMDTAREVGAIYGDGEPCNGYAHAPDSVVAVYNGQVKCIGMHEDTHLISFLRGRPEQALLREGLAMYMDRVWWKRPNEDWCRDFLRQGTMLSIADLMADDFFYGQPAELTYPISGAFTRYLTEALTPAGFLDRVYYAPDPPQAMERETGLTLRELNDAFVRSLANP